MNKFCNTVFTDGRGCLASRLEVLLAILHFHVFHVSYGWTYEASQPANLFKVPKLPNPSALKLQLPILI